MTKHAGLNIRQILNEYLLHLLYATMDIVICDASRDEKVTQKHEPMSVVLNVLADQLTDDKVHVRDLVLRLQRRSFGGLLIVLALFGLMPGISLFAGLAMMVPAIQMMLGRSAPVMPGFVGAREVDVAQLKSITRRITPRLEYLERYVRPRWVSLTDAPVPNFMGLLIFLLSLLLMLPIPFSNFLPAVAIILLALGLLERDGLTLVGGLIIASVAMIVGIFAIVTVLAGLDAMMTRFF